MKNIVHIPILELNGKLTMADDYVGEETLILQNHPENEDMLLLRFSGIDLGIDKKELYFSVLNCAKPYRRENPTSTGVCEYD